ncbi:lytic transglycosylase domain-containing protein [Microbacterium marinilacus]|nr:lytic transglycosylase domain-containing protein [Microbacterium marinilacus]
MLRVLSEREAEPSVPSGPRAGAAEVAPSAAPSPSTGGIASRVDPEWVARVADEAGIPQRALAAYAGAALALAAESAGCGVGWNTLAGIGYVESLHGTIHGSSIDADGVARPGILGIPLDGSPLSDGSPTTQVPDTDGGALDGDATWDRAVGPMQFIPSTWEIYGRDGNGDGVADPHQIDDAALAAATYLCAAGGDLRVPQNWIAAVAAYNADVAYNNRVAAAADGYALAG